MKKNNKDVIKVINFGHPLSLKAKEMIVKKLSKDYEKDIDLQEVIINSTIDVNAPKEVQYSKVIDNTFNLVDLSGRSPVYILLPGLSLSVAMLISMLAGLTGTLPKVINLKRDNKLGIFVMDEILDLEHIRQNARSKRYNN